MICFVVYGVAQPAGSKNARAIWRRNPDGSRSMVTRPDGSPVLTTSDANKKILSWKQEVRAAAVKAMNGRPLLHGPLRMTLEFTMPRPQGHYRTGKHAGELKPNAPVYHTVKPDRTKLTRGLEDALTGIVWRDDAQVADGPTRKVYGETAAVKVIVEPILESVAALNTEPLGVGAAAVPYLF